MALSCGKIRSREIGGPEDPYLSSNLNAQEQGPRHSYSDVFSGSSGFAAGWSRVMHSAPFGVVGLVGKFRRMSQLFATIDFSVPDHIQYSIFGHWSLLLLKGAFYIILPVLHTF